MTWNVDPELLSIGSLSIRWYGLFFMSAFIIGQLTADRWFLAQGEDKKLSTKYITYLMIGALVGARIAHCFFYDWSYYSRHPMEIIMIWKGGLASHGGYVGMIIMAYAFVRRFKKFSLFQMADFGCPPALLGGALIRLGNFFNSEILGKASDVPWAITFSRIDTIPRHPTQLYESLGYLSVSAISYFVYKKHKGQWGEGRILGLTFVNAFTFRFFIEFFKENQSAFESGMTFNMGQWLSIPMVLIGLVMLFDKMPRKDLLKKLKIIH
jgi:phosphatidylglycerol:prolipoprotein diacylglycerol transferase